MMPMTPSEGADSAFTIQCSRSAAWWTARNGLEIIRSSKYGEISILSWSRANQGTSLARLCYLEYIHAVGLTNPMDAMVEEGGHHF